ncbi:MAG: hypothetical protein M9955_21680 [Rhizobiaceae bacterium]|nr:hypothetical protein [Rhizobiaceae bacterium]
MSVFGFSKTDEVWGLKRSIVLDMIDWWIESAGPRPYLVKIKQSYGYGYNHGDLTEVGDADKAELRDLVQLMLRFGYENELRLDPAAMSRVRESLIELERLINGDLEGTPLHRQMDGLS